MKKLLPFFACLLGLLLTSQLGHAQLPLGAAVPPLRLAPVLNGPHPQLSLAQLRGQVVVLEFWGTWCGPCVAAMPHLQDLQRQFAGRVQVVAISNDTPERLTRYLQARPSNLLFASVRGTAADSLQHLFAYRTVPHTVVLDATGHLVASTEPQHLTAAVLKQVLAGRAIDLPWKQDKLLADPLATIFPATAASLPRFLMQPAQPGLGSMLRTYPQDTSAFRDRRLSALNLSLEALYRLAYGGLSHRRILDLRPAPSAKETLYCLDLLVAKGSEADLLPRLRQELAARFDLRATLEPRPQAVYLLQMAAPGKLPVASAAAGSRSSVAASHGSYQGDNVTLAEVADYLESFGLVRLPVLAENPAPTRYNLHFEYQPEKAGDLLRTLADLGLTLEKAERPVEMLVLR